VTTEDGFSVAARVRSFGHAFAGVAALLTTQHNAWIHALATVAVLVAGVVLRVSALEWALLCLAIGLVWLAEGLNTALEALCDRVAPEPHPLVRRAKDVAAGGVLLAACAAAAAGLIIFLPKLLVLAGLA
jgi:diacylglycerol kinase (ATP)